MHCWLRELGPHFWMCTFLLAPPAPALPHCLPVFPFSFPAAACSRVSKSIPGLARPTHTHIRLFVLLCKGCVIGSYYFFTRRARAPLPTSPVGKRWTPDILRQTARNREISFGNCYLLAEPCYVCVRSTGCLLAWLNAHSVIGSVCLVPLRYHSSPQHLIINSPARLGLRVRSMV